MSTENQVPEWRAWASKLKWRYYWNARASFFYLLAGRRPRGVALRIVADLRRQGIAQTTVEELFGDTRLFEELAQKVEALERDQAEALEQARQVAGSRQAKKSFVWNVLGDRPTFDPQDVFVRFCLRPEILTAANAYFGLFTQLRFFNVWRNFKTDAPAQRSQLWHRDREDKTILKVFVYLSDVSPGSGPLVYAPGTHAAGKIKNEPETFKEAGHGNSRAEDDAMAKVVPQEQWIHCLGRRGSVVFCDTTGYHRGGLARTDDRLVFNFMFVSPTADCPISFAPPAAKPVFPDLEAAFAAGAGEAKA